MVIISVRCESALVRFVDVVSPTRIFFCKRNIFLPRERERERIRELIWINAMTRILINRVRALIAVLSIVVSRIVGPYTYISVVLRFYSRHAQ